MASSPRIVAELGRPETPDEAAARKAASSRAYRSSQTARNLVGALLVTLAIVAVVIAIVPRGEPAPRDPIDVAAIAERIAGADGRFVVVPDVPEDWLVNRAVVGGEGPRAWTMVFVPGDDAGFVNIAQGFDADPAWPARMLNGAGSDGTVTIEGVEWSTYSIADPSRAGNISAALSATAGADTILVYGATSDDNLQRAAASVAAQILELREETP